MKKHIPALLSSALIAVSALHGQEVLDELVVSASLLPQKPEDISSSLTQFDVKELEKRGILDLRTALNQANGVHSTSTAGQRGAIGSLHLRGTVTSQSALIVDGVRLNHGTIQGGLFLGNAGLLGSSKLEIIRGPQSPLYGANAMGGAVLLSSQAQDGPLSGRIRMEGGSFNTIHASLLSGGDLGPLRHSLSLGYEATENDRDFDNDFVQYGASLHLEGDLANDWVLGFTSRWLDSHYESPASNDTETQLLSTYLAGEILPNWTNRLTLAYFKEDYYHSGFSFGSLAEQYSIAADEQIELHEQLSLAAGGFYNNYDYTNISAFSPFKERRAHYGLYANLLWEPISWLDLTGGLRWEDDKSFGEQWTGRFSANIAVGEKLNFWGAVGTAFRPPTYLDLYSPFSGNEELKAEESTGWELGLRSEYAEGHNLELVAFTNRIDNSIFYQGFSPAANSDSAQDTHGLEATFDGHFFDEHLFYQIGYSHLGEGVADLPEHTLKARLEISPIEKWRFGVEGHFLSSHSINSNFEGTPSYFLARLYAHGDINENFSLFGRVENLFDRDYYLADPSDIYGYTPPIQGNGIGLHLGASWNW